MSKDRRSKTELWKLTKKPLIDIIARHEKDLDWYLEFFKARHELINKQDSELRELRRDKIELEATKLVLYSTISRTNEALLENDILKRGS